jgi:hypothetical protein
MESRQPPPINGGLNQQYPPKAATQELHFLQNPTN